MNKIIFILIYLLDNKLKLERVRRDLSNPAWIWDGNKKVFNLYCYLKKLFYKRINMSKMENKKQKSINCKKTSIQKKKKKLFS